MNFFFDVAHAMAAPQGGQGGENTLGFLLPMLMIFAVMYFLIIRPQKKQADKQRQFINSLEKGVEVITSGGICGKIVGVAEQTVTLEIAEKVRIKVVKANISRAFEVVKSNENVKSIQAAKK